MPIIPQVTIDKGRAKQMARAKGIKTTQYINGFCALLATYHARMHATIIPRGLDIDI
jgi:hypothetical protein